MGKRDATETAHSKITANSDRSHEIKTLAPWKENCDRPTVCLIAQSCPILAIPMDYNLPAYSVHGIL